MPNPHIKAITDYNRFLMPITNQRWRHPSRTDTCWVVWSSNSRISSPDQWPDYLGVIQAAMFSQLLFISVNVSAILDSRYKRSIRRKRKYGTLHTLRNFQPLEVVSRYRDPQPQVVENYPYLINFRPNIYKSGCLKSQFIRNISIYSYFLFLNF